MQNCINCIWFLEQKGILYDYCMMKQPDNKNPEEKNNCKYFALRIR